MEATATSPAKKAWLAVTQARAKESGETRVYTWGAGAYGQLGLDLKNARGLKHQIALPTVVKGLKNVREVSAFADYTLCRHESGQVYGFGQNFKGRLGFEVCDKDIIGLPKIIPSLVNIVKVDAGMWHSLALDGEGQAWSAGYGAHGELGRAKTAEDADQFGKVLQVVPF
jgi:alpha-tubulin suppressor-like RCC1 family protein